MFVITCYLKLSITCVYLHRVGGILHLHRVPYCGISKGWLLNAVVQFWLKIGIHEGHHLTIDLATSYL